MDIIPLTEEDIARLKGKHRDVYRFSLDRGGQALVVRAPDEAEFQRAMDKMADGGPRKAEAINEIGEACLVFPDRATIEDIASRQPGIYFTSGNKALELAGLSEGYGGKKL